MTGQTADRERVWTETQEWLNDLDRDEAGADFDSSAADRGGDDANDATVSAPAGSDTDSGDDQLAYDTPGYDDTPAHINGAPVDLDNGGPDLTDADADGIDPLSDHDDDSAARPARYNKTLALGFASATVVTTLVVAGALMAMRGGTATTAQDHTGGPSTQVSVMAAPTTTGPAAANSDSTIPYTATAVGCLPGSTAAQSVAGPDSTQAWVCVHGGNIGQHLQLNLGATMVITAVSITPGWVGTDASGADQWQQHRVLTRVQWSFNDSPPTVVPQETASVHGDAVKPMPDHGVLASRIIMLVQETARAPADTGPTTSTGPAPGGLLDGVLGPPAPGEPTPPSSTAVLPGVPDDQSHTDPADNTFAVSSIKIFGHPPQ